MAKLIGLFVFLLAFSSSGNAQSATTCTILTTLAAVETAAQRATKASSAEDRRYARDTLKTLFSTIDAHDLKGAGWQGDLKPFLESRRRVLNGAGWKLSGRLSRGEYYDRLALPLYEMLRSNRCDMSLQVSSADAGGERRLAGGGTGDLSFKSFGILKPAISIAMVFLLLMSLPLMYRALNRYRFSRIRRTQRFSCTVTVPIRCGQKAGEATLHDISEVGGKLTLDTEPEEKASVVVMILGEWRQGRVLWCKGPFFWVEFSRRLRPAEMRDIVGGKRWYRRFADRLPMPE